MALARKLTRIGNSKGFIVPQPVLDQLQWDDDSDFEMRIQGSEMVLVKVEYATDAQAKTAAAKVFKNRRGLMERLAR